MPDPATIAELKAAFPTASAEFHVTCLEKGLTMADAKDAYIAEQTKAIEAANAKVAEVEAKAAEAIAAAQKPTGVKPVEDSKGEQAVIENPIQAYEEAVAAKTKAGQPRHRAMKAVAHEQPELREAYVEAWNQKRR